MKGIGIDVSSISRFESISNSRFLEKYFCDIEIKYILSKNKKSTETMAGMFSAKEAVLKAMGVGIGYCSLRDICILHDDKGKPFVVLHENALKIYESLDSNSIHISISHDAGIAMAIAIIE